MNNSPFNVLYPKDVGKLVNIGGRIVEWKTVLKFLNSVELELVPFNYNVVNIGSNWSTRKKGGVRKLHKLQFGINYDQTEKAKGSSLFK